MYIVDFLKRMMRKANIPILIYLILNVLVITMFVEMGFENSSNPYLKAFGVSMVLYGSSITIALSPIGEWILRMQTGCKEIKRQDVLDYIMPIFNEVYAHAREVDPSIPNDVRLFMNDDAVPNAFATGRKTVCITEGLLEMHPAMIKATLGHEFGHLAHKDTDLVLVVYVGNMIVNAIILLFRIIFDLLHIGMNIVAAIIDGPEGTFAMALNGVYRLMITLFVATLLKLWSKLGTALVMKSSRSNEYEADEFSYGLGYGNAMCALLDVIGDSKAEGLFAALAASHPASKDRIARLQQLGATYGRKYGA